MRLILAALALFASCSWANVQNDGKTGTFTTDQSLCDTVLPFGQAYIHLDGSTGSGTLKLEMLDKDGSTWFVARAFTETSFSNLSEMYDFGVEAMSVRLTLAGSTSPTLTCRVFPFNVRQR